MNKADLKRRWIGAVFLIIAVGMLITGQTIFRSKLQGGSFILFWMVCLVFTFLTMMVALLDLSATRRRLTDEQRTLLEKTVEEIAAEQESRQRKTAGGHNGHIER